MLRSSIALNKVSWLNLADLIVLARVQECPNAMYCPTAIYCIKNEPSSVGNC